MGRIRGLGVPTAVLATSIVQLGDSVAAGDGTLHGYRYDRAAQRWTGGDLDAPCPDSSWLDRPQLRYLSSLGHRLDRMIRTSIAGLHDPRVAVADSARAYTGGGADHRWCSRDPWAYGLSVLHPLDPETLHSQAPFHPTPAGQRAIAALVAPVARRVLAGS